MEQHKSTVAGMAIVVAQLSMYVGAGLGKGLFPLIGPEGVAVFRTGVSALILLAMARPWRVRLDRHQALSIVAYGLALGGMNLLIYWAFEKIPIGIAVAIEITGPLAVVVLSCRSLRDFCWLALAVGGLLLLVPWSESDTALDPRGIFAALGAAICWALYIIFGKKASAVDGIIAVSLGMSVACLLTAPFGISAAGGNLLLPYVLAWGCLVAVLSSALPYALEMVALRRLSSRIFGVMVSSSPAIAALAGFLVLGERLTAIQWLAIVVMVTASTTTIPTISPS